jgi:hypothetical protein
MLYGFIENQRHPARDTAKSVNNPNINEIRIDKMPVEKEIPDIFFKKKARTSSPDFNGTAFFTGATPNLINSSVRKGTSLPRALNTSLHSSAGKNILENTDITRETNKQTGDILDRTSIVP